jgi:hypothetical protein
MAFSAKADAASIDTTLGDVGEVFKVNYTVEFD